MQVRDVLHNAAELALWESVPGEVKRLYKLAAPITSRIKAIAQALPANKGYGDVFWHPKDRELYAMIGHADEARQNRWYNSLKAITGVSRVQLGKDELPPNHRDWVRVKRAAPLGIVGKAQDFMGQLTGGPSPMTNALTGALLTGGLGYGAGTLLEHLFPERYVERGRLRKTLGVAGAAAGTLPHLWQASANARDADAAGQPLGIKALWTPNDRAPHPDLATPAFKAASAQLKRAFEDFGGGLGLQAVPMDAFNQAIWNDVRRGQAASQNPYGSKDPWGSNSQNMHTPRQLGAATAGIVSGIQEMSGNQPVLSPRHFINGLATAGVDMATARVVGGVLGALGGLTPEAQNKIQEVGLWGGLLRGTVGSMLGL